MILVVKRREWGAPKSKWGEGPGLEIPVENVFCLSTNKRACYNFEECTKELLYLTNRHTQSTKCPDIKYSFVIGCDGRVYEGRGWKTRPGLPVEHQDLNKHSIFIALTGYYREKRVPKIMLDARDDLIRYGLDHEYIDEDYVLHSSFD